MTKKYVVFALALALWSAIGFAQAINARPRQIGAAAQGLGQANKPEYLTAAASETAEPWRKLSEDAKQKMAENKFSEAKEALKTAIRIAPMNASLWALYDEAAECDYVERKRREKFSPVIARDIQPLFHIMRVDSYIELDTLYVVGSVLNTSGQQRQKIVLTAKLFDENKSELKQAVGRLIMPDRGLMPNESSLFEIPFKRFPPGVKSVRVEVSSWE